MTYFDVVTVPEAPAFPEGQGQAYNVMGVYNIRLLREEEGDFVQNVLSRSD